jgi:manganese/zinc/iron transport system substrate-binding protein
LHRVIKLKYVILLIAVSMGALCVIYVYRHDAGVVPDKRIMIVATTSIIADAVRVVAGNSASVHALMGPGVDPHLYRARESDVHKLAEADIVFYNGLHLEGKMGQVLEGMNRFAKVIAVSDVLDKNQLRRADFDEMYDPHIWFDVSLWIQVVHCIQNNMIQYDQENAAFYQKNGDEYVQRLEQLNQYVHDQVSIITPEKRILITAHDAFGYFGRAYGFEVVGLQGLSTDSDISTKEIKQLADYIVEKKVKAIFVESSIPQRTLIAVQNAVRARGWNVVVGDELYSDALGDETTQASDYCGMITHNIDVIVSSLVG